MARAAKEGLDGADIYSGCCTLKIEYAKVSFRLQRATTYLDGSLGRHSSLERHRYSFLGRMPEIIFFSFFFICWAPCVENVDILAHDA